MNKAKIKSNLISFGVAFLVALVICAVVVAIHFLTPRSSASAEVSSVVVNTTYQNVAYSESDDGLYPYEVLSSSGTISLPFSIQYLSENALIQDSSFVYLYSHSGGPRVGWTYEYSFIFGDNISVCLNFTVFVDEIMGVHSVSSDWVDENSDSISDGDLLVTFTSSPANDTSSQWFWYIIPYCLDDYSAPAPWPSVLPPNTNADSVVTNITSQTDYYIVESYFTDSNSEGDYDIGAGISLDNSSAGFSFTFFYNGIGYTGNSVSVYYREDTSVAKALSIVTFVGTSQSNNTMTIKCWRYETLISNVYTAYNYWTNAVDDSVKLADYSIRVVFLSPPSASTTADWFAYSTLSNGLTDTLPSFAPTFGGSVAVNFVTWYSKAFSDSTITQLDLVGYEITNASDYLVNGSCRVDVKLITNESITPSDTLTADDYLHIDNVLLYPINGKYYLILSCTQAIKSIRVNFVSQSDFATIGTGLQLSAYIANGTTIEALKNFSYNEGRVLGYNQGYQAGATNENNLMSLIWYTFELPFKIMFGTYDNNQDSPTYQQYVGGLFNFEFLGLDIRAFVLSVISVCLIIAIIKLILGNRGGSNG